MKKSSKILSAILCVLLVACLGVTACAEENVPTINLVVPEMSEVYKTLVAGKTYEAAIALGDCYGEDEDSTYTVHISVCEQLHFNGQQIENAQVNDVVVFAPDNAFMIMEKTADETGFAMKDGEGNVYYFIKQEDGTYVARTQTDNMFYAQVFGVTVLLGKDISFLDWSDPENLEAPEKKGYEDLLKLLLEDTNFSPYNTKVTFDAEGVLSELLYTYSPWN